MKLNLETFLTFNKTGQYINGRAIRDGGPEWGQGVWWSERLDGVIGPIAARIGPLGYENDPPDPRVDPPIDHGC